MSHTLYTSYLLCHFIFIMTLGNVSVHFRDGKTEAEARSSTAGPVAEAGFPALTDVQGCDLVEHQPLSSGVIPEHVVSSRKE